MWNTDWNDKASLRWLPLTGKHNITDADPRNYFSPHLVRINSHPIVLRHGDAMVRRLQKRHLFRYLAATEAIEIEMVNPALRTVMSRDIAPAFVLDAYKIYADEGFHALMCMDLRRNVSDGSMPYLHRYRSLALQKTLALSEAADADDADLILLAITCVNETMIASSLSQATDHSVFPALRDLVMAHAKDEAAHNIYFTQLMGDLFPRLSTREQRLLRDLMPDIFNCLHLSDLQGAANDLLGEGFTPAEVDTVLHESFAGPVDHEGMRRVCRSSMRMLERCGFFDHAVAHEGFRAGGLGYLLEPSPALTASAG